MLHIVVHLHPFAFRPPPLLLGRGSCLSALPVSCKSGSGGGLNIYRLVLSLNAPIHPSFLLFSSSFFPCFCLTLCCCLFIPLPPSTQLRFPETDLMTYDGKKKKHGILCIGAAGLALGESKGLLMCCTCLFAFLALLLHADGLAFYSSSLLCLCLLSISPRSDPFCTLFLPFPPFPPFPPSARFSSHSRFVSFPTFLPLPPT